MGPDPTVGVVAKRGADRARELATTLVETLGEAGVEVRLDESTAGSADESIEGVPVASMDDCDLVVSVGGDGTLLFVVREVGSVPVVGVNLGEVGFLNGVDPDAAVETVRSLVETLRTGGALDWRPLTRLRAEGGDGEWSLEPALNEVVVQAGRRGPAGGVDLTVTVDGDEFASGRADGVVVATSTGSTAYNLSDGGPIVAPGVDALVITHQCGADARSPLVVPRDGEVTVSVAGAGSAHAVADGRATRELDPPTTVSIRSADAPARLAGPPVDFYEALEKLE